MAVSKKKTKKKASSGEASAAKRKKASKAPAAAKKKKTPAKSGKRIQQTAEPRAKKGKQESSLADAAQLERALAETLFMLQNMKEDRDTHAAIAEAADAERSMIADELEEARERIRQLEERIKEPHEPATVSASPEDAIDYDEEEPEEESEDFDEVESIYTRMDDPRVRRQELDRERMDRESESGDEPYWFVCPKCGGTLEEVDTGDVKVDRCENCTGLYVDQGEVEMLLSITRGPDGLQRIRSILQY
jgi:hypothetical protein